MERIDYFNIHWDENLPYGQNALNLLDRFVWLPEHEIQKRVVAGFGCLNLTQINNAPTLYLNGSSGSGKSTTSDLLAALAGVESIMATAAATRNYIESIRKGDEEDESEEEKHILVPFDDISKETIKKGTPMNDLIKISFDRGKPMQIAKEGGSNLKFYPFSLKIMSSTYNPFIDFNENEEFIRRTIFIHCRRPSNEIYEQLDEISNYSFEGIREKFDEHWRSIKNRRLHKELYQSLRVPRGSITDINKWKLTRLLIAAGVTMGVFKNETEALELFERYWEYRRTIEQGYIPPLEAAIIEALNFIKRVNAFVEDVDGHDAISLQAIQERIFQRIGKKQLPFDKLSMKEVFNAIQKLGYQQVTNSRGEICFLVEN